MENDGVSSGSQRSGSGVRAERSSSSTQGFFAGKVGNERDGAAPKCRCGVYAIVYLSKTSKNPNRLFFGYPFFKIGGPHCKFLLWLDEHAAKFDKKESVKCEEGEDVNLHFATLNIDDRLGVLEDKVATMEKRKGMNMFLIVTGLVVGLISMWESRA
ncbi:hypothetical protein PIB30_011644 [Stylosanthes scabra]|uniref:Zinc finger GRF-type domain-containing protein n=1 Tax=Stylosanthes scabra TaxID=79078 RepID=A0ABU6W924_9FABA|nr:hypothetical protein [Stylosanthes scabra]